MYNRRNINCVYEIILFILLYLSHVSRFFNYSKFFKKYQLNKDSMLSINDSLFKSRCRIYIVVGL